MDKQSHTPDQRQLTVFFSAGEPSGDLHGANLIRELRSQCDNFQAVGYGGPQMAAAGCKLHADLTALAVMWFARALLNIHKFWNLAGLADRYFRHHRPDAVVLIDYPGFNWWIARRAKAHGIPVFYYCPPQIWAWASWRVKKMRRFVDHVLCSLPFEKKWFTDRGCNATFVGHPFFDEVNRLANDENFMREQRSKGGPLVTILPGSRTQEVTHNLAWFLKAASLVAERVPNVRFAVAAFRPHQAEIARQEIARQEISRQETDKNRLPVEVHVGRTPELMQLADCCMACSGSVSLELLYHKKPTVILYWITPFAYFVQKFFRHSRYITLVNMLTSDNLFLSDGTTPEENRREAEAAVFPEYLTSGDKSRQIADNVIAWLSDQERRQSVEDELAKIKDQVAHGGASRRTAQYILETLKQRPPSARRPHISVATTRCDETLSKGNS